MIRDVLRFADGDVCAEMGFYLQYVASGQIEAGGCDLELADETTAAKTGHYVEYKWIC